MRDPVDGPVELMYWWLFAVGIAISVLAVCIPLRGDGGRRDWFDEPRVRPYPQRRIYDQDEVDR